MLTQIELKRVWNYNFITGQFTRLVATSNVVKVGDVASFINNKGYIVIKINNKNYKGHRLAHLYMTGEFPADQIDHIDGIRNNNCWLNLRDATNSLNAQNTHWLRLDNTSGYAGISWCKRNHKWRAQITLNSKCITLGYFDCKHQAGAYRLQKKRELHEGCTI